MTPRVIVLGCVWCLFVPALALGQGPATNSEGPALSREGNEAAQTLIGHVEARYAQTRDFQADFTQELRIEGFDTPIRSAGRVYLKKPGRLRWDYLEPTVEHMYVHDDRLEVYVPHHHQVVKGSLSIMVATKAPLQLLQGIGRITEHFSVHPTGDGEVGEGGLPLLTLIPKTDRDSAPSSMTRIVADIQPETYFIRSLALHESNGNVSTFRFSNIKANTGLDETVLTLNPPEGVVIVEPFEDQGGPFGAQGKDVLPQQRPVTSDR